jgi:hypothetical protein
MQALSLYIYIYIYTFSLFLSHSLSLSLSLSLELPYTSVMEAAEGYAFDAGTCLKLLLYEALSY